MSIVELQNLSDIEILQMQWDILEQIKQKRVPITPPSPEASIPKTEYKEGSLLKKIEDAFTQKDTNPAPSKRKRTHYPPEVLPNGLELVHTQCELYSDVYYEGNGIIKSAGGMMIPLNINQLAHLMEHMDQVPKRGKLKRQEWCKKQYGVSSTVFDKIIWNIYRGTFNEIFEYYFNKNYRINFDKNGNLKIGE